MLVLYLPALHDHLEMDPLGLVAQLAYLATGGLAGGLLAANCASIWTMHERSALAKNEQYIFLMHKVLYPVCVYLIPLILISVLNIRMLASIRKASRRLASAGQRKRMEREKRSVRLLIAIVLLFFLCHTG
uniref:G-protein coupled receptors family 1 profile domain-containing protein n=1 Tax=Meloidogyne javanica TaxID=6303 RepID=A0A915N0G7_MELJA